MYFRILYRYWAYKPAISNYSEQPFDIHREDLGQQTFSIHREDLDRWKGDHSGVKFTQVKDLSGKVPTRTRNREKSGASTTKYFSEEQKKSGNRNKRQIFAKSEMNVTFEQSPPDRRQRQIGDKCHF